MAMAVRNGPTLWTLRPSARWFSADGVVGPNRIWRARSAEIQAFFLARYGKPLPPVADIISKYAQVYEAPHDTDDMRLIPRGGMVADAVTQFCVNGSYDQLMHQLGDIRDGRGTTIVVRECLGLTSEQVATVRAVILGGTVNSLSDGARLYVTDVFCALLASPVSRSVYVRLPPRFGTTTAVALCMMATVCVLRDVVVGNATTLGIRQCQGNKREAERLLFELTSKFGFRMPLPGSYAFGGTARLVLGGIGIPHDATDTVVTLSRRSTPAPAWRPKPILAKKRFE